MPDEPLIIRQYQRQLFISACFRGGTQRCFSSGFAISINIFYLLLILLRHSRDSGVLGDAQFLTHGHLADLKRRGRG